MISIVSIVIGIISTYLLYIQITKRKKVMALIILLIVIIISSALVAVWNRLEANTVYTGILYEKKIQIDFPSQFETTAEEGYLKISSESQSYLASAYIALRGELSINEELERLKAQNPDTRILEQTEDSFIVVFTKTVDSPRQYVISASYFLKDYVMHLIWEQASVIKINREINRFLNPQIPTLDS
jgi:hypothetical protein